MKKEEVILEDAKKVVHDSGNQSWHSIALECVKLSREDLFNYLQDQANLEENKSLTPEDFLDKMERILILW